MNIIWALLNILVFAAIINFAFRIQNKHSNGSAILFLFFAFILFSGSVKKEKVSPINPDEKHGEKIGNFDIKIVENNPDIRLYATIFKQKNSQTVKIVGSSDITGLVLGLTWQHIAVNVSRTENPNIWKYTLIGVLDYRILGSPIYSQQKVLTGKLNFKNKELVPIF